MAGTQNLPDRFYRVVDGKLQTLRLLKVNKVSIDLIDDRGVQVRERRRAMELRIDVPVLDAKHNRFWHKSPWRRTPAAAWRDAVAVQRLDVKTAFANIAHTERELVKDKKKHKEAERELAAFERQLANAAK